MSKPNQITLHANKMREVTGRLCEAARAGKLLTWRVDDKKGTRFTHTASSEQWEERAWLVMVPDPRDLQVVHFKLRPSDGTIGYDKEDVEGVYLGRFIEMLVNRFGEDISSIEVGRG